jgi:hypothetical protein
VVASDRATYGASCYDELHRWPSPGERRARTMVGYKVDLGYDDVNRIAGNFGDPSGEVGESGDAAD